MAILIDGYNLLHAAGIFPPDHLPATLQHAREALVDFLCRVLGPEDSQRTTIVFDARHAPPGLPRQIVRGGMTLLFAPRTQSADEVLAELIQRDHVPRQLTVVSSDHQVQRAARRRKARAVDSEAWCAELARASTRSQRESGPNDELAEKPQQPLTDAEVAWWRERFERR